MKKKFFLVLALLIFVFGSVAYARTMSSAEALKIRNVSDWEYYSEGTNLISQSPDPAEPGGYVEVRFKVENIGSKTMNDVILEIMPKYPFSLEPGDSIYRKLGDVEARQVGEDAIVAYWKLRIDKDAVEGNNKIQVRYSRDGGLIWVTPDPFNVRIQTHDAIVLIDEIKTTPENLEPGKEFRLDLILKNNADSFVKDVYVMLDLYNEHATATAFVESEQPFTPVGGSNEVVVETIGSGQKKTLSFKLAVDTDANSEVHKIPILLTYYDQLGNVYNRTPIIGLVVNEEPKLIYNIEKSDVYGKGMMGSVSIKISNIGSSGVNYMVLELLKSQDYEIISPSIDYIGSIDSDDYETGEFTIYLKSKNENPLLKLRMSYNDDLNNYYVKEVNDLRIKTYTSGEAKRYGLVSSAGISSFFLSLPIITVLLAFWIYMFVNCIKNKMPKYHKLLWIIMFIFANILGAVLYYFLGRRKKSLGGK